MRHCPFVLLFACAIGVTAAPCRAAQIEFTIDPSLSSLTLTSSTLIFGSPLATTPQGAGSLTTTYSGSIWADVTATTIQFLPATSLVAGNSGNWRPGTDYSNYPGDVGTPGGYVATAAPANYGIVTDLTPLGPVIGQTGLSNSAIRGLAIALSDAVPRALAGGAFSEAGIATDFTAGLVYYSSGGTPPITDLANTVNPLPLVDVPAVTGTLIESAGVQTLTIPVSFTVTYNVNFLLVSTRYDGTIVATALVPEPSSIVLFSTAVGCLLVFGRGVVRQRAARRPANLKSCHSHGKGISCV